MSLLLPSLGYFKIYNTLIKHAKTYAFNNGYAVSIKRSKRDKFVYLRYDRGRAYRNALNLTKETQKRETSSQLIECSFELYGRKQKDKEQNKAKQMYIAD
ncbi:27694_t:CDS:2, partial [Racocetra persica]